MFATIRRYESIDQARTNELVKKADETVSLTELPGFTGYCPSRPATASSAPSASSTLRRTPTSRAASSSNWVREQKLETALPNQPKITSGEVVVHKTSEPVQA